MTREDLATTSKAEMQSYLIHGEDFGSMSCVLFPKMLRLFNKVFDNFELRICDNCKHDYCGCSVQDSILQANPEATFTTFGCNSFTSKD